MAVAWDGTTYTEVFVSTHDDVGWTDFSRLSTSGLQSTRIAAVADRGIVHVTWGERSTPHPFDSRPDMILYSNNEGGVWSEPVRLFHNPRHVFSRAQALAADHNGDLHMVVGTRDTLTNRAILVAAQRVGTSWSDPRVIATMGGAPAIADDANWLVVGYIRPAMPTGGGIDVNSVFAIRSGDGGATWRDTTMVHRSGTTPALDPVVLATSGSIHMLWLQDRTGDVYAEAILHSESADGVAWSTPRVVAEPGSGIQSFAVVSDRFGRLHLVYQHSGGGGFPPQPPMRGFYTQWTGMRWSVPVQMFDWAGVGQVMSLTVSEQHSLHLAATLSAEDPLQGLFLTSAYVGAGTNQSCCRRDDDRVQAKRVRRRLTRGA